MPIVRAEHESGLNGIAVDVDFAANPYIYVCAARDADGTGSGAPWLNEVLRYQVMPDRSLANAAVIFTGAAAAFQHNGCCRRDGCVRQAVAGDRRRCGRGEGPGSR